jgi:hypothetical protein
VTTIPEVLNLLKQLLLVREKLDADVLHLRKAGDGEEPLTIHLCVIIAAMAKHV